MLFLRKGKDKKKLEDASFFQSIIIKKNAKNKNSFRLFNVKSKFLISRLMFLLLETNFSL